VSASKSSPHPVQGPVADLALIQCFVLAPKFLLLFRSNSRSSPASIELCALVVLILIVLRAITTIVRIRNSHAAQILACVVYRTYVVGILQVIWLDISTRQRDGILGECSDSNLHRHVSLNTSFGGDLGLGGVIPIVDHFSIHGGCGAGSALGHFGYVGKAGFLCVRCMGKGVCTRNRKIWGTETRSKGMCAGESEVEFVGS
jgi:hypothetical protein